MITIMVRIMKRIVMIIIMRITTMIIQYMVIIMLLKEPLQVLLPSFLLIAGLSLMKNMSENSVINKKDKKIARKSTRRVMNHLQDKTEQNGKLDRIV